LEDRAVEGHLPVTTAVAPATIEELRLLFPGLRPITSAELRVLEAQIGRRPRGDVLSAARCPHDRPAVILTAPFETHGGRTPPLLWLCCPNAAREVSALEGAGWISRVKSRLEAEPAALDRFLSEEERFWGTVGPPVSSALGRDASRRLGTRGVAWGRPGAVKCLHSHLAFRLSVGDPTEPRLSKADQPENEPPHEPLLPAADRGGLIGLWCIEELEKRSGVWCEKIPEACLH
jgi:hypothetical protein